MFGMCVDNGGNNMYELGIGKVQIIMNIFHIKVYGMM